MSQSGSVMRRWLAHTKKTTRSSSLILKPGATQRMALDTLMAVSARRWNTTVITDNWNDFKAIQRYCNVKIVKGSDFFSVSPFASRLGSGLGLFVDDPSVFEFDDAVAVARVLF